MAIQVADRIAPDFPSQEDDYALDTDGRQAYIWGMEMDPKLLQARIEKLRQEISGLIARDRESRRGSFVRLDAQMQHQARIVRIQEIKDELAKISRGKK